MWTLGLDIGTTGCKAVVFDSNWDIKKISYREYDLVPAGKNKFDLNQELVWSNIQEIILEANNSLENNQIEAMAISALGDVIIPIGRDGNAVRPSIVDFDPTLGYVPQQIFLADESVAANIVFYCCKHFFTIGCK